MTKIILSAIAASTLLTAVSATPAPQLDKRFKQDVDCTSSEIGAKPGLLFAVAPDGTNYNCDQISTAKTGDGTTCYITTSKKGVLGDPTKCPADPPPKKNPDGSDAQVIAGGVMQAWCNAASGGQFGFEFANLIGCMIYGFYEAQGNPIKEAQQGAKGICDIVFAGACTWFMDIAPGIAEGMNRPCKDDPGSNACAFANPGK